MDWLLRQNTVITWKARRRIALTLNLNRGLAGDTCSGVRAKIPKGNGP